MPMKRIVSLVVIILLVLSGCSSESNSNSYNVDYDDPESVYSAAQTMYKEQDVYNAKILFESIPEYKDSQVCINKINCLIDLIGNYFHLDYKNQPFVLNALISYLFHLHRE